MVYRCHVVERCCLFDCRTCSNKVVGSNRNKLTADFTIDTKTQPPAYFPHPMYPPWLFSSQPLFHTRIFLTLYTPFSFTIKTLPLCTPHGCSSLNLPTSPSWQLTRPAAKTHVQTVHLIASISCCFYSVYRSRNHPLIPTYTSLARWEGELRRSLCGDTPLWFITLTFAVPCPDGPWFVFMNRRERD